MQQPKYRKSLLILVLGAALAQGCSTDPDEELPYFLTDYGSASGTFKDLLTPEERKDLAGIIQVVWSKKNTLEHLSSQTSYEVFTGTSSDGTVRLANSEGQSMDIKEIRINDCDFERQGKGWYELYTPNLHFDSASQNYVKIDLGDGRGVSIDSFLLASKVLITNLSPGQQISRSDSIKIEWSGANSDPASILFLLRDAAEDSVGVGWTTGHRVRNTGSCALKVAPVQMRKGLTDIFLTQYEKRFVSLPSGKKICILVETQNIVSVYVVD